VNNHESTQRQPNLWLTLLVFMATIMVAFILPELWFAQSDLPREAAGACASAIVFAFYTFIYRRPQPVSQRQGIQLTLLMFAGPWLFAGINVWGKGFPTSLTMTSAVTGLLIAVSIGVSEELLFRGILFRAFQGRSAALYVLVTSITFGLLHYEHGFLGVITTTIVGVSYSLARVAGTPLSLLIVCHAITDYPNQFPHTPHSQYSLAASGALGLIFSIAVLFFSHRTNWAATVVNPRQLVHDSDQS
jgi:membrane protease YdiL (CAAX protease family)